MSGVIGSMRRTLLSCTILARNGLIGLAASALPFAAPAYAADASLLGTLRRGKGSRQVTYAGKPLYYYVGDREALQVLCQNVSEFGGLWLVVRPSGATVR